MTFVGSRIEMAIVAIDFFSDVPGFSALGRVIR
jgi:hypothetical protein